MLGTSTASGNFSDEGETCVIFTSALISSRYFNFLDGVSFVSKSTGQAINSQTDCAFAFKL